MSPPPRPKYTVFVSSTQSDLSEEREAVIAEILKLGHIPCGMEQFSAANERVWGIIKDTIDICDYYVVIVAGRYGSVDEHGVSYTQREFEYAQSIGVPALAFIRAPSKITIDKAEQDPDKQKKLQDFIAHIELGKIRERWMDSTDLSGKVAVALVKQIERDLQKGAPRPGWYRGDNLPPEKGVAEELATLIQENRQLRAAASSAAQKPKLSLRLAPDRPVPEKWSFSKTRYTLESEEQHTHIYAAALGLDRRSIQQVIDRASRVIWLQFCIVNLGTAPAKAIRAYFKLWPCDDVVFDISEYSLAPSTWYRDRSRPAHVESYAKSSKGPIWSVRQSIHSIGIRQDQYTVPIGCIVPEPEYDEAECKIEYHLDEEHGEQVDGELTFKVTFGDVVALPFEEIKRRAEKNET